MNVWKMSIKYWDMIPSLRGFGATTGAEIMPNKMHHFSSDFICYATSKVDAYGM